MNCPGPHFANPKHAGIKPAATDLCEHLRLENESIARVAAGFMPACFGFAKCGSGQFIHTFSREGKLAGEEFLPKSAPSRSLVRTKPRFWYGSGIAGGS